MPFEQPLETSTYSMVEAETALCIFEELDRRTATDNPDRCPAVSRWREDNGVYALRHAALGLAGAVDALYNAIPGDEWDGLAFDWHIVPAILNWVVWTDEGPFLILGEGKPTATLIMKTLRRDVFGEEWDPKSIW